MKILYLCKRTYTRNQDVIKDHYGRLYEIPKYLSEHGHELRCIVLSYKRKEELDFAESKNLRWKSINALSKFGLAYIYKTYNEIENFSPDLIIASSDVFHIAFGSHLAKKYKLPFIADLYDNYESFGMAKIPGFTYLFRRALKAAQHITVVTNSLKQKTITDTGNNSVSVIENGINKSRFFKLDSDKARRSLNLDRDSYYIGISGALDSSRGIEYFLEGFRLAQEQRPELTLVMAGDLQPKLNLSKIRYLYLGRLQHDQMNSFYNAMNVNCISLTSSKFGNYAFPQKAYEMVAAESAYVIPQMEALMEIFPPNMPGFYIPANPESICDAILMPPPSNQSTSVETLSWDEVCTKFLSVIVNF
jgi:glycosyltransferase involved in cell wall biosynthesis